MLYEYAGGGSSTHRKVSPAPGKRPRTWRKPARLPVSLRAGDKFIMPAPVGMCKRRPFNLKNERGS
jgi:hypothetical protein